MQPLRVKSLFAVLMNTSLGKMSCLPISRSLCKTCHAAVGI